MILLHGACLHHHVLTSPIFYLASIVLFQNRYFIHEVIYLHDAPSLHLLELSETSVDEESRLLCLGAGPDVGNTEKTAEFELILDLFLVTGCDVNWFPAWVALDF